MYHITKDKGVPMPSHTTGFPHPELIGTFRQFGPFGIPKKKNKKKNKTGKKKKEIKNKRCRAN